jgi:hypothetical protein
MATIPLPNNNLPISTSPSMPSQNPLETMAPSGNNSNFTDVLNAAVAAPIPSQGAFSAPTVRPNQDLMQNVSAVPSQPITNPTIELLQTMAANMGNDPAILETINRLKMQGA